MKPLASRWTGCKSLVHALHVLPMVLPLTFFALGCPDSTVEVKPTAPVVKISTPTQAAVVYPGAVTFAGTVEDQIDAPTQLKTTWHITLGGVEKTCDSAPDANGKVTCTMTLEQGGYQLALSATNSSNLTGTAAVGFTVENFGPAAIITAPKDGTTVLEGDMVRFEGTARDPDEDSSALSVAWSSDKDGDLGTSTPDDNGLVTLETDALSAQSHTVTMSVTDPLGEVASASILLTVKSCPDQDGDGHSTCDRPGEPADCDDNNAAVYPGAVEICDGIDNDCNGKADETFDEDGDGYTTCQNDCNDKDATIHPDATEYCDGVDNNCDTQIDEEIDSDGDGLTPCKGDCDDGNAAVYLGAEEVCDGADNNCDGQSDEGFDEDNDDVTTCQGDCDDSNAGVHPEAFEVCNRIDDDCNGTVDDGYDLDGDGFTSCGMTADTADCNDVNPAVYPGAAEICDRVDNNCNGQTDEGFDLDGDGFTSCTGDCDDTRSDVSPAVAEVCDGADNNCNGKTDEGFDNDNDGVTSCAGDCNDGNAGVKPGATELCNGIDDDCDGKVDNGFDNDGDGYTACGSASVAKDCNDNNSDVNPGATEVCDAKDNNCNGVIDEGFDQDGDGYATCATADRTADCDDHAAGVNPGAAEKCDGVDNNCDGKIDENFDQDADGFTTCQGDCDDTRASVYPGAGELCNGLDDNCNGRVDDGYDADNDGYTSCNGDCDDSNPSIHKGAPELCNGIDDNCDGKIDDNSDADKDGYTSCGGDCDDSNASVHPGAKETCNGADDNCDGKTDEGFDADKDGYTSCNGDCNDSNPGVNPGVVESCNGRDDNCDGKTDEGFDADKDGYTTCNGDCDDANAAVHPGVTETCNGKDDNCDGKIDESFDADKDGYTTCNGDCDDTKSAVNPGAAEVCDGIDNNCDGKKDEGFDKDADGYTTCNGDCDDANASVHPGVTETCNGKDDNCDGKIDESFDADKDGYTTCNGDCDDTKSAVNPGAAEVCDGIDNNCNGKKDEGFDLDGDGYTTCNGDCDDTNPAVHKNATELCNGIDDNCDGKVDENADADKDGYTNCNGDCDDTNPAIHPGVTEACNGKDDNCDGKIDEGFDKDADGYTTCNGDCDDTSAAVHPGVTETCNGKDDNCDGQIDEGLKKTYYLDSDKDSYGNPASSTQACTVPTGYVADNTDCDDSRASVHPGAVETCNAIDDNCDGQTDEGLLQTWYRDADSDGYGTSSSTTQACSAPSGYVSSSTDCNDADGTIHPGATELCNGKDDNCDGQTDEGVQSTWYQDADGDGYGNAAKSSTGCSKPAGYVTDKTDCNDASASIHPNAAEVVCNAVDENCNGTTDDHPDKDADSYDVCNTGVVGADANAADCNDNDPLTYPGAPERFDGKDNNCDGVLESQVVLSDAFSYTGSAAGANAGFSVAGPGDVNADVYGDIVIGAPGYGSGKGAAYLVMGHLNWADDVALSTGSITLTEDSAGSNTGYSVGAAGDLNKDGYMDFAVGAPYYAGSYPKGGVAYILFGRPTWTSGLMSSTANSSVKGLNSNTEVGMSIGGGGDVNGDGLADLLIGAPWPGGTGSGAGWVMILPGKISGWTPSISPDNLAKLTGTPGEGVGYSVATTGNVTGDAFGDMVIGSQYNSSSYGDAWLITGRTDLAAGVTYGPSALGGSRYYGKTSGEFVGTSVSAAGDVNGDGKMDFLVGRKTDGNGTDAKAYLFFGGSSMPSSSTAQSAAPVRFDGLSTDKCPCSVAGVGDIDGDGYADFVIGVAKNTEVNGGGKVYLFYGGPTGTFLSATLLSDADMVFYGEASGDQAGYAVSAAGDVDGDGYADFAVGAPYNDQAGTDAGKVYVMLGFPRN